MKRLIPNFYAWLLRLYPAAFRERFSVEMQYVFDQAWFKIQPAGWLVIVRFCFREYRGLLKSILNIRFTMTKFMVNSRLLVLIFAVVSMVIGAVLSRSYWGYMFAPVSADAVTSAFQEIHSIHLVRYDADYQASVIPISGLSATSVADFPPTRVLPVLSNRFDSSVFESASPASELINQIADAMREAEIPLNNIRGFSPQPLYCLARTDTCFEDVALLQPDQHYSVIYGYELQADGTIRTIMPVWNNDSIPSAETTTASITPNEGWFYFGQLMPAGFVIQGTDRNGLPLVLANIATSTGGNDHYAYHEFLFDVGSDGLHTRAAVNYQFDVSGIDGITFPIISLAVFLPLCFLWLAVIVIRTVLMSIIKTVSPPNRVVE